MTLSQVTHQIYRLSVNGTINGEHFTYSRFYNMINAMFSTPNATRYIGQIALPDGEWWFKIVRYATYPGDCHEYDYTIPDTPEQSERIRQELLGSVKAGK